MGKKEEVSSKSDRIKELVSILNKASKAYYQDAAEIMSNYEYDALYDELVALEKETGIVLSDSPTVNVGYEVVSALTKEEHESRMLSLDKTKSVDELAAFCGDKECVLSWKLDGLTIVLTYENGTLQKAVTRGNGSVGEIVTPNARTFKNIPVSIDYKDKLVIRGEAIITYSDFEKINEQIEEASAKYKNPRNLCSGSVRTLNSEVTSKRNVRFVAFSLIEAEGVDFNNSIDGQLSWLDERGFETVERVIVNENTVHDAVATFSKKIETYDYPSDGLVLMYDDIEYGKSLGVTEKYPRNGIAFKWEDQQEETTLKYIEWSPSRTGLINPVAVFEPVELEGTTVSRASIHNVSIMEEMKLKSGDRILVYKANMIIPQISENLTKTGPEKPPAKCPTCGKKTVVKDLDGVKTLYCPNKDCPAKNIKSFGLFVSRNGLNIVGLSEETIEKFIDFGFIKDFSDIYHLDRYEDEICSMSGFGRRSYEKIKDAVEQSRLVKPENFIYALGITGVGSANAKLICAHFDNDIERIMNATKEELLEIDGLGDVLSDAFTNFFKDKDNMRKAKELLSELKMDIPEKSGDSMKGLTFVITGKPQPEKDHGITFANRDELKAYIEERGGKVAGSVSGNTSYLINNDINSTSGKNKKAKELSVPIISVDDLLERWE